MGKKAKPEDCCPGSGVVQQTNVVQSSGLNLSRKRIATERLVILLGVTEREACIVIDQH